MAPDKDQEVRNMIAKFNNDAKRQKTESSSMDNQSTSDGQTIPPPTPTSLPPSEQNQQPPAQVDQVDQPPDQVVFNYHFLIPHKKKLFSQLHFHLIPQFIWTLAQKIAHNLSSSENSMMMKVTIAMKVM